MKPSVKSAVESAIVAALVGAAFLWFLISAGMADEVNTAKMTLLSLGLAASLLAHLTYLGQALRRDGRSLVLWMVGLVLLFPVVSVVALVILTSSDEDRSAEIA